MLTQEVIDERWLYVRTERNEKLTTCDWTQLSDCQLSVEKKLEWTTYRQELRDITNQSDPFNIIWPTKPS